MSRNNSNRGNYGNTNNNYSANGLAGDGGMYMSSQSESSPGAGSPSQKGSRTGPYNQSLIPVTIKQLLSASQDHPDGTGFKLDGRELNQITIVGVILSVTKKDTNVQFKLSDSSGVIEVRIWMDSSDNNDVIALKEKDWKEGAYVRVIGHLRSFLNSRSVLAFRIIPITNFNEVTFHHLDVIYVHLYNTFGPPANATNAGQQSNNFFQGGGNGYVPNQSSTGGDRLTDFQRMVLGTFKESRDVNGTHTNAVIQRLNSRGYPASAFEVREAIQFLNNEGHIYSTIDDETFSACDPN